MDVKTITVIGAGAMGRGIAYAAAFGGFRTILEDVSNSTLNQGIAWIKQTFDEDVSRGTLDAKTRDTALAQLTAMNSVENASRRADLIIEAVPEEMEMKIELFTIFDKFAKPGAIFASNTSSLSITEMAAVTFCPERCIGMHFCNPDPRRKLLKLLKGAETSEETISTCREVARRMGKEVVVVHEAPSSSAWRSGG
jgi:3-hydroxybutyryl-CoA dehydrogenase